MFNSSELRDALQALKDDVSRLLTATGNESSMLRSTAPRLAEQIEARLKKPAATAPSSAAPAQR